MELYVKPSMYKAMNNVVEADESECSGKNKAEDICRKNDCTVSGIIVKPVTEIFIKALCYLTEILLRAFRNLLLITTQVYTMFAKNSIVGRELTRMN